MDFQDMLNNVVKAGRAESFDESGQLTLGELLLKLKAIPDKKGDKNVYFDFGSAVPTDFNSWRGSYAEIALGYALTGYDSTGDKREAPKLSELIKATEEAIGTTYNGWKGGDYTMTKNTSVWVANRGNSDETGIVGVLDNDWNVVLLTWHCEF